MKEPLGQHIAKLELRLNALSSQLMDNSKTQAERNQLQAEIRAVNLALSHYRDAFELEKTLVGG